jgi:hypothetical protein
MYPISALSLTPLILKIGEYGLVGGLGVTLILAIKKHSERKSMTKVIILGVLASLGWVLLLGLITVLFIVPSVYKITSP